MLAVESIYRQHIFADPVSMDQGVHDPYSGMAFNGYGSYDSNSSFSSLPYGYIDAQSLSTESSQPQGDDLSHPYMKAPYSSAENPPSTLSTASGPSVPSATSSTVGSPYSGPVHTLSYQDVWSTSHQGLGVDPAIIPNDNYNYGFGTAEFESDIKYAMHNKATEDFVGESQKVSPFVQPSIVQSTTSLPIRSSRPQDTLSLSTISVPKAQENPKGESMTIDTILERANRAIDDAIALRSPPSAHPSDRTSRNAQSGQLTSSTKNKKNGGFKSPITPASATPETPKSISHPSARPSGSAPSPNHTSHFQSHFFSQSSGNFVPPLETSCRFPCVLPVFLCLPSPYSFHKYILPIHNTNLCRFLDPSLIQSSRTSGVQQAPILAGDNMYQQIAGRPFTSYSPAPSPVPSQHAAPVQAYSTAPYAQNQSPQITYSSFDQQAFARAPSVISEHSYQSHQSPLSGTFETDEEGRQKGRCPHPECGKVFKDLKAHMLTHQSERPEKCPILTCEYNQKGFARKYDKNRHTLTHYKGTMVCGFCPGSGSAAEKSFNRADVFKRHLTTVHGVEQTPPNSRKRSPGSNKKLSNYCQDATGKCSTCSATFNNAQDFYEHLDDCVLRVVQQEEPSEAINQQHLSAVSADDAVKATLDRHMLTDSIPLKIEDQEDEDDDEEEDDEDDDGEESAANPRSGKGQIRAPKTAAGSSRVVLGTSSAITKAGKGGRKGLTYSKGGVPLVGKGRKKRKHYPPSWGMSPDKMKMKKRVLCVYDGQRRLWKDDMMLDNEFEVRMKLGDGKSYVTDLDVETIKRAEAIHASTEDERGPYNPEQAFGYTQFMS